MCLSSNTTTHTDIKLSHCLLNSLLPLQSRTLDSRIVALNAQVAKLRAQLGATKTDLDQSIAQRGHLERQVRLCQA